MRWAKIFRSGRHTSRQGLERNYPVSELHQAAESYNPAIYKAPLIIDHDTRGVPDSEVVHTSFCYGYPELLKVVGTTLKAGFEYVAPEFLEWIDKRNLVAVSPGFYLPEDPRNPTPGLLHARHIAALGDKPPSVKNNGDLSDLLVEFSEEDPGLFLPGLELEFEFEEQEPINLDGLLLSAFQPVIEKLSGLVATEFTEKEQIMTKPAEPAATIIRPAISGDRLAAILAKGGSTAKEQQEIFTHLGVEFCEYSEPEPTTQEKALAKREADLADREAKIRQQAIADFAEPLVREGRLLAADKAGIVAVLGAVEAIQDVEYSEGDKSKAPGELLKNFLKRLPIQIEFSELAQAADDQGDDAPDFEEAPGYSVDSARLKLHQKALAHQKKHGGDYSAAVKAVGGR